MKILEVSSFMPPHPGGLELAADNLARGLSDRGHDVRWIASATPCEPGRKEDRIRVAAWNALEERWNVPWPIWGPRGYAELLSQCRWADVVHVHDCLYLSSAAAVLSAKRIGKPVVMTQHIARVPYASPWLDRVQSAAYLTLGRGLLELVDGVACYSPHVSAYFASIGVRREFELIPLGFDDRFRPPTDEAQRLLRAQWGVPARGKVALFAGRLVPKKGIFDVIEVQRRLAPKGVTLLVAGDGPLAHELAPVPGVRHVQQVPYERMHELYALADALFLPSRGEGLPLTLQEAMLTGLPAVVSTDPSYVANVGSAPGVWMREGADALATAMEEALSGTTSRSEIAVWARQAWGREKSLSGYERLFRSALEP